MLGFLVQHRNGDALELADNHAERQNARAEQEEHRLEGLSRGGEEMAAEHLAPAINQHGGDGKRDSHDGGSPEGRGSRVAHPHLLVS